MMDATENGFKDSTGEKIKNNKKTSWPMVFNANYAKKKFY